MSRGTWSSQHGPLRGLYRDRETEARRSLITPLKNDRVFKKAFKDRVGLDVNEHFGPELERLKGFGLIEEDDKTIFLTERGRFFADDSGKANHGWPVGKPGLAEEKR